jgi:hypothetical protein
MYNSMTQVRIVNLQQILFMTTILEMLNSVKS